MSTGATLQRAAVADRPVVHLYTVCWDEADMLGFFFRHYDPWVTRYVVYDDGSTDGSRDILAAHPRVELRSFDRTDPDSFVLSHKAMQDHAWKESRGTADWVVITAIDEHLHVPGLDMAAYLATQARAGVTLIPALGFDMNAPAMPDDRGMLVERVTRGRPRIGFNKLSLFRPDAIAETGFGPGRHAAEPTGHLVLPEHDRVMLWHFKHLGFARNAAREASQALRLGRRDVTDGYGQHYLWPRAKLRAFWDEMETEATDLAADGFSPVESCKGPLWWRNAAFASPAPRPKVSVLIKAYNHAAYVRQTVQSVLDQSFVDFEIVVTDDGSSDGTPEILQGFSDPRIDVLALPMNQGIPAAMNATLARARGAYLAILNSDDWALPERLARQVAFLDANPQIDAVFGMPHPVDERGEPTAAYNDFAAMLELAGMPREAWLRQFFFAGNGLCSPTAMIRRSAYDRAGLYDTRLTALQDLDMWIRMLVAGCRFDILPEPVTAFRIRDDAANASAYGMASNLRTEFELTQILKRYAALDRTVFDAVFGAAEPASLPPDAPMQARLGELALGVPRPSYRAFALECLHAVATEPNEIARLRALTGAIDHFGEWTLAERDNRLTTAARDLAERDARIADLERAVADATSAPPPPATGGQSVGTARDTHETGPSAALPSQVPLLGPSAPTDAEGRRTSPEPGRCNDPSPTATDAEPARLSKAAAPRPSLAARLRSQASTAAHRLQRSCEKVDTLATGLVRRIPSVRAATHRARVARVLDADWYRSQNPGIGRSDDPVGHYLAVGAAQGCAPHPLFDPDWYARSGPSGDNPLLHFLEVGHAALRDPHPLFSVSWYLAQNPDVREKGYNALVHYLTHGAREGRSPHPLFDVPWYNAQNQGAEIRDPVVHYLTGQGANPHPLFDEAFYRAAIPDLAALGYAPLTHYVARGAAAGFDPNPVFATAWYVDNHETLHESGENPLVHYQRDGVREGRDPHPSFDTEWYLDAYPDVARSGMNPLVHYLRSGRGEGRATRQPDRTAADSPVLAIPYEIRRVPPPLAGREACVFVTHSPDGRIAPPTLAYLAALRDAGLVVVLVVATDGLDRPLPDLADLAAGVILRTNHGWDFAAWACALAVVPDLWRAERLILANDSIIGPADPAGFSKMLQRIRRCTADVVALTDSHQVRHHLMSYFTVLRGRALHAEQVRTFWSGVRSLADKQAVIEAYELLPVARLAEAGLTHAVLFPTKPRAGRAINPTLDGWRDLVADGFPFLKAQLIRDRIAQCDPAGWRAAFHANPALLDAVEAEHGPRKPRAPVLARPIPAPRRRYHRRPQLSTFYGATQSTRPTQATDLSLELPFRFAVDRSLLPDRVAIIAHVFYPDLCDEIRTWFANIPVRSDLFVSTDTDRKKTAIEQAFACFPGGSVTVRVFPNVGRDVAPMLVGFADVLRDYDVFLHVHAKRSLHTRRMAPWRDHLFRHLLGSPEIVAAILALLAEPGMGIVFPEHFEPVRPSLNWGGNYDAARELLRRAGVALSKDLMLEFPSGSFYWGRSAALRPLLDLGLSFSDFPDEAGQVDGTLAHAIERSVLYAAEGSGHRWVKIGLAGEPNPETRMPVLGPETLADDLVRIGRSLLHNRLGALPARRLIPEIADIPTRRDANLRPRLNLVIPTLAPEQTFGGITTALKVFSQIAEALGPGCDRRILCRNHAVDLRAMAELPGYVLVQAGAPDAFPKVVVDLADPDGGELGLRRNDVFLATAWWTATNAYRWQAVQGAYFGAERPVIYLIQDHEPDFYGWSSQHALARETYEHGEKTIALINSEELAEVMTRRYHLPDAQVVRFFINPAIARNLIPCRRERIIVVYGRPSTARNAFPTLCAALQLWQQANPTAARIWRIISVGEAYAPEQAGVIENLEIAGKLPLGAYAELLSRASIGVALMLSPHPSYPPLEMAQAGLLTITNGAEGKDLSRRATGIVSLDHATPQRLAAALERAVAEAETAWIGRVRDRTRIVDLPCGIPEFNAGHIAARVMSWL